VGGGDAPLHGRPVGGQAEEAGSGGRVSCHNLGALKTAANCPWVEVILARINPKGASMDGTVEDVLPVLKTAKATAKALIGMKIYGEGKLANMKEELHALREEPRSSRCDDPPRREPRADERIAQPVRERGLSFALVPPERALHWPARAIRCGRGNAGDWHWGRSGPKTAFNLRRWGSSWRMPSWASSKA